jgi:hypothetical protein
MQSRLPLGIDMNCDDAIGSNCVGLSAVGLKSIEPQRRLAKIGAKSAW